MNHELPFDEMQLKAVLAMEQTGVRNWQAELNPVMMEEWAKRTEKDWLNGPSEALLEFVMAVNDHNFLPVAPQWVDIFDGLGVSPVIWTVGCKDRVLIKASFRPGILSPLLDKTVINNKFMEVLADLDPDELTVTVDSKGVDIQIWWD